MTPEAALATLKTIEDVVCNDSERAIPMSAPIHERRQIALARVAMVVQIYCAHTIAAPLETILEESRK